MTDLKKIEKQGTDAVRRLRLQKLRNGHPFMINSKELLTNECYLEFPDGTIKLATIKKSSRDFDIIRVLNPTETESLRNRLRLYF
jgi:hypothetical protein